MRQRIILGFAAMLMAGSVASVHADIVNYGSFDTNEIGFLNVTEVTGSSCLRVFGEPFSVGNGLVFMSTTSDGSSLSSTNGAFDFINGSLSLVLEADPGLAINEIRVRHFGSISTYGESSLAQISSSGFATVGTEVFASGFSAESSGNQFGGQFDRTYSIAFPSAERVVLSVQDQLFTFADSASGFAFVGTQGVIIQAFTATSIPEPALGAGIAMMFGFCFTRRRLSVV